MISPDKIPTIISEHFELFSKNTKIPITNVEIINIHEIQPNLKNQSLDSLIHLFSKNMVFVTQTSDGLFGIRELFSKDTNPKFIEKLYSTIIKSAYLVELSCKFLEMNIQTYCILTKNPKPDDITTIVNTITSSYCTLKSKQIIKNSPLKISFDFTDGFGRDSAHYEAVIDPRCDRDHLINCDGRVHGSDRGIFTSADAKIKIDKSGDCCIMKYAFVGTGGWPDVDISFPQEMGGISIKIGKWGWTYFKESGIITNCCSHDEK